MAVTMRQAAHKDWDGFADPTLASAALAGSLLVTWVTVDKNASSIPVPSGGWTLIGTAYVGASVGGAAAYKIAAGGETGVTWDWTSSNPGDATIVELVGWEGTPTLDTFALANSGESNVSSLAIGPTGSMTDGNKIALACVGLDSRSSWPGITWNNSFTTLTDYVEDNPGHWIGWRTVTGTGTLSVTGTRSSGSGTDQAWGHLAVFLDVVEGEDDVVVEGARATETDTATAGATSVATAGSRATETDTANAGTPTVAVAGARATQTATATAGAPNITMAGSKATTTVTANSGTPAIVTAGQRATSTSTGTAGTPAVVVDGARATETDAARSGSTGEDTVVEGARATETDTGHAGTPAVVVAGSRATSTAQARGGIPVITLTGARATSTAAGRAGAPAFTIPGQLAAEVETAIGGIPLLVVTGARATETDTARAGGVDDGSARPGHVELDPPVAPTVTVTARAATVTLAAEAAAVTLTAQGDT